VKSFLTAQWIVFDVGEFSCIGKLPFCIIIRYIKLVVTDDANALMQLSWALAMLQSLFSIAAHQPNSKLFFSRPDLVDIPLLVKTEFVDAELPQQILLKWIRNTMVDDVVFAFVF
jgi:hypothetical protein